VGGCAALGALASGTLRLLSVGRETSTSRNSNGSSIHHNRFFFPLSYGEKPNRRLRRLLFQTIVVGAEPLVKQNLKCLCYPGENYGAKSRLL
jgi:hypothetical protein